jgi:hypothetical protein
MNAGLISFFLPEKIIFFYSTVQTLYTCINTSYQVYTLGSQVWTWYYKPVPSIPFIELSSIKI